MRSNQKQLDLIADELEMQNKEKLDALLGKMKV